MSINSETASEYFRLAALSAERGNTSEALRYSECATNLLLRGSIETEAPGTVIGESFRFSHLGKVLAAKAKLAVGR